MQAKYYELSSLLVECFSKVFAPIKLNLRGLIWSQRITPQPMAQHAGSTQRAFPAWFILFTQRLLKTALIWLVYDIAAIRKLVIHLNIIVKNLDYELVWDIVALKPPKKGSPSFIGQVWLNEFFNGGARSCVTTSWRTIGAPDNAAADARERVPPSLCDGTTCLTPPVASLNCGNWISFFARDRMGYSRYLTMNQKKKPVVRTRRASP